jgi:hypothetical protein
MDEATTSRESYVRRPGRRKLFNSKRPGSLDMQKVTRHARKSTTPKKADEKTNESNSWHEIGRTSVETSVETSGEICNEFGSGSAAKFCGEVAQGCKNPFTPFRRFRAKRMSAV